MSQSYCHLWVHLVWATKGRNPWLRKTKRNMLLEHIRNYANGKDYHIDMTNGVDDHLHCLVSFKTSNTIGRIVNDIKGESSHWINEINLFQMEHPFRWQGGYSAFTVGFKEVNRIRNYIINQEEHHNKISYEKELKKLIGK